MRDASRCGGVCARQLARLAQPAQRAQLAQLAQPVQLAQLAQLALLASLAQQSMLKLRVPCTTEHVGRPAGIRQHCSEGGWSTTLLVEGRFADWCPVPLFTDNLVIYPLCCPLFNGSFLCPFQKKSADPRTVHTR